MLQQIVNSRNPRSLVMSDLQKFGHNCYHQVDCATKTQENNAFNSREFDFCGMLPLFTTVIFIAILALIILVTASLALFGFKIKSVNEMDSYSVALEEEANAGIDMQIDSIGGEQDKIFRDKNGTKSKETEKDSSFVTVDSSPNLREIKDSSGPSESFTDSSYYTESYTTGTTATGTTATGTTEESSFSSDGDLEDVKSLSHFTHEEKVDLKLKTLSLSALDEIKRKRKKIYERGEIVRGRYLVGDSVGAGTFGQVVAATDLTTRESVALKVITNPKRQNMARDEIRVLRKLSHEDPRGRYKWVQMKTSFTFNTHFFIVFELLGPSVYDYLKDHDYEPYKLPEIRHIAYQVCEAIAFLHRCKLAHTDLKPENIVFVDKCFNELKNTTVKIIDFGTAYFEDEGFSGTISTRHYRAPEVVLRVGWSYPADVWSIGCILYEMYTGNVLFLRTTNNLSHLAMMELVLGPIPESMIILSERADYFEDGKVKIPPETLSKLKNKCPPLLKACKTEFQHHTELFALIMIMLTYDPKARIDCRTALDDVFFASLPEYQKLD